MALEAALTGLASWRAIQWPMKKVRHLRGSDAKIPQEACQNRTIVPE